VCRYKYLAGYAIIAFASAIVIQIILALGLYSVGISVLENPDELSLRFLMEANLVYLPAQWIMLGIAVLLIGLQPKATGAVWGYFTFSLFMMFFGRMNIFPEWLQKLTPFGYVPQLPMDEINFVTLSLLTGIAAALTALGFIFYRRRDINAITH
jgi:ABC-2 type transport system permease protein